MNIIQIFLLITLSIDILTTIGFVIYIMIDCYSAKKQMKKEKEKFDKIVKQINKDIERELFFAELNEIRNESKDDNGGENKNE